MKFDIDSSRAIKINPKTVIEDYKLTYEDKIVPEKPEPGVDIPKEWIEEWGNIWEKLNLPFYVQFKGNELEVSFGYTISECAHHGGSIILLRYYSPKEKFIFTKSGWHWMPVIK
ncbi:MAG: hypothetical protein AB1630_10865 [bacterium]